MLHLHFGTGRLGLGLVAPFFQTPDSELYLLNRTSSGKSPNGRSGLSASRRNELLSNNSSKRYLIGSPGTSPPCDGSQPREQVHYNGFCPFEEGEIESIIHGILEQSAQKSEGVVVTGSVLTAANYAPVVDALNAICSAKDRGDSEIGDVYLIACENTVSAYEVLQHEDLAKRAEEATHRHVRCVYALVDRVCVSMQECDFEGEPTLYVEAEEYGLVKLELCSHTEGLPHLLHGSRAEFSRYLDAEKDIKIWLLNGSQWLIALTALQETEGDANVKLNEFINSTENHQLYASEVVNEMRLGVEALLRSEPKYAEFSENENVSAYLDGAASSILERFRSNADTVTRILARFRAPTPDEVTTVQSFVDRFLPRVEPPLLAYQAETGAPPKSATQGIFNLFRLQASGTYVDTAKAHETTQA